MYVVKPYEQVAWTTTKGLWATWNTVAKEIIDVYEDREMAEAWVEYTNRKKNNG